MDWGLKNRLSKIIKPKTGHTVMLAVDHGYFMGPTTGLDDFKAMVDADTAHELRPHGVWVVSLWPGLVRTERTWDDSDVMLLGVVYQDSRANAERFLAEYGGDWTHVIDPAQRTAIDYGVYGVPETYFIGRDGLISLKKRHVVITDLQGLKDLVC